MIKYGDKGPLVRELQTRLQKLGFDPGSIDGDFGSLTLAAWREFEQGYLIDYKMVTDEEFTVLKQLSDNIPGMPVSIPSEQEDFLRFVIPFAKEVMTKTGLPASVSVGQAILETSYGKSELARNALNYHGIKAAFGGGDLLPRSAFPEWTGDAYRLQDDEPNASRFMVFSKVQDSFWTHDRWFCYWDHYHPYFAFADDPYMFLKSISKHYATSPTYFDNVWAIIEKHRLTEIDRNVVVNTESPWKELHQASHSPKKEYKVAIMPGHGGNDPGAVNPRLNVREETYNWLEAEEIKRILEGRGNYQVFICRDQDELVVTHSVFKERANNTNADVCLCLHHNAFNGQAQGWWLFYVDEKPRHKQFIEIMDKHFRALPIRSRGYEYAGKPFAQDWFGRIWTCIGGCIMPTILFESCFIDNDVECKWLADGNYKLIAQKICDGVREYLEEGI